MSKKPGGYALAGYGHVGGNKAFVHALEGTGGYSPRMQRAARRIKAGDDRPSTEDPIGASRVEELPSREHPRAVAGEGEAVHRPVRLGLPGGVHVAGDRVDRGEVGAALAVDGSERSTYVDLLARDYHRPHHVDLAAHHGVYCGV